ncbi:MAG TPA: NAD(P)H-quinone oxidoreductase [Polyangiaceae bacterium]|nr:NAD(P)H-quinone oxidoreductase [Polyangiaceae bacterium]
MKAIVVAERGGPENLKLAEVPDPELLPGTVVLEVKATALNRADLLQRRGLYPPPKGETDILGLECSGVVAAVGDGVGSVRVGDRVMALLPGGGYATRVRIPEKMAIPIPASLDFVQAAAIPEAFLTAREALFTLGRLSPGDTVLVHAAAGGVGSAAVELAKLAGARVIATAGSAEKLARVKELGADVLVNYKTEDFAEVVLAETKKAGAAVALDFVGAAYFQKHMSCLSVGGRLVVIGVMGGANAELNLATLLMRRTQILGLVMRSRPVLDKIAITQTFIRESLPHFGTGALRAVVDSTFPLADAGKAHERMEANENFGKIVLTMD